MTLRLVDQNLGGFGSELRANARVGYMTDLSAEYYRLLTPGGYFIEPRAGILREPVYIWANQKRIAERFLQNLDAGVEAGRTFSNQLQISAEWRAEDTRWGLRTGSGGGPYLTGTAQTGLLHIKIDKAAAGAISPNGFRLSASAGALYHAVASDNAPLVKLTFSATRSWREVNIFGLSGEVNSYLRANVAQPYRSPWAAPCASPHPPLTSSAAPTPTWPAPAICAGLRLCPPAWDRASTASSATRPARSGRRKQRRFSARMASPAWWPTRPIGLFTFGVSVGDAGHRKVFVTLGRWF